MVSEGVASAPVEEMVVEPVPPNAAVFAVRREEKKVVEVALVSVVLPVKLLVPENVLLPEKVLEFARSVEDAAVMVISAVPLKETPLMLRAV